MEITDQMLDRLAYLSRLEFDANERELYRSDLQKMVEFVEKLRELDVSGVEPLRHLVPSSVGLRDDEANVQVSREDALKNAGKHDGTYFLAPAAIKKQDQNPPNTG